MRLRKCDFRSSSSASTGIERLAKGFDANAMPCDAIAKAHGRIAKAYEVIANECGATANGYARITKGCSAISGRDAVFAGVTDSFAWPDQAIAGRFGAV
jgi:hypothetical protein